MGLMPSASRPVRKRCMRTARPIECAFVDWASQRRGQGTSLYMWYCSSTVAVPVCASALRKGPMSPGRSGKGGGERGEQVREEGINFGGVQNQLGKGCKGSIARNLAQGRRDKPWGGGGSRG